MSALNSSVRTSRLARDGKIVFCAIVSAALRDCNQRKVRRMSSRLQPIALSSERVTLVFSIAYALLPRSARGFFHSLSQDRKTSPFLSILCARFARNAGVSPLRASLSSSCHTFSNPLFSHSCKLLPPQLLCFDNHLNCLGGGVSPFSLPHYITTSLLPSLP